MLFDICGHVQVRVRCSVSAQKERAGRRAEKARYGSVPRRNTTPRASRARFAATMPHAFIRIRGYHTLNVPTTAVQRPLIFAVSSSMPPDERPLPTLCRIIPRRTPSIKKHATARDIAHHDIERAGHSSMRAEKNEIQSRQDI